MWKIKAAAYSEGFCQQFHSTGLSNYGNNCDANSVALIEHYSQNGS